MARAAKSWWDKRYPTLVAPPRRAAYFADAVGFPVGIYLLPPESAKKIH